MAQARVWFFSTARHIIATNTNAKFQVNQTRDEKVMLWTKNWMPPARLYAMGDPIIPPVFYRRISCRCLSFSENLNLLQHHDDAWHL